MNLTGVVVCYNTPELIRDSVQSIRNFYKNLQIIIIDHSQNGSNCWREVQSIKRLGNISLIQTNKNLGHGIGLNMGIEHVKTDNILIFDSDIVMRVPCLEVMMMGLSKDTYGIGQVIKVDKNGVNNNDGIEYLHPHFAIIKKDFYNIFAPFRNHGAPLLDTMKGLSYSNVKIKDFPVSNYILHKERGTVNTIRPVRVQQKIKQNGLSLHKA